MTQKSDANGPGARRPRTALFAGSFNPFTIGHKSIADRTLSLCDRLVIAVGSNIAKRGVDADASAAAIRALYSGDPRVEVLVYEGLTADLAKRIGADFMVRGVRNVADFEAERTLAEANLALGGVETMLMPALPALGYVSSSLVRELEAHGADASTLLPSPHAKC